MESSVKNKIEHYCAYQERCHYDVKNKLNKLGIFGDQLDELQFRLKTQTRIFDFSNLKEPKNFNLLNF